MHIYLGTILEDGDELNEASFDDFSLEIHTGVYQSGNAAVLWS